MVRRAAEEDAQEHARGEDGGWGIDEAGDAAEGGRDDGVVGGDAVQAADVAVDELGRQRAVACDLGEAEIAAGGGPDLRR